MKKNEFTPTPTLGDNKSRLVSGFTLIEVIIYIALFSIMMGSLIVVIFQIIKNSEKITSSDHIQEEINFVLKKLDWALIDSYSIDQPLQEFSQVLEVNKNNFIDNPITFKLNTIDSNYHYVEYCINNTYCNPITTKNVKVENLLFTRLNKIGIKPDGVKIIININGVEIENIKYLQL